MKNVILLLFISLGLFLANYCFAQQTLIPQSSNQTNTHGKRAGKWTILYDTQWKLTDNPEQVAYYRIITYKEGKPIGKVIDYARNGQKQWEGFLLSDQPEEVLDGISTWYHANGKKQMQVFYKEGKKHGKFTSFYEDGKKKEEGMYVNGLETGAWIFYQPDGSRGKPDWERLYAISTNHFDENSLDTAIAYGQQALFKAEEEFGKTHSNYAITLNHLASVYDVLGDYAQAESFYRQVLAIREKVPGVAHPDYASALNNLAYILKLQGNYKQAEILYKQALTIWEKTIGKQQADYAFSLSNLASLYDTQGKYNEAEKLYKQAILILRKTAGEAHPDYATLLNNLAYVYKVQGDYRQAEEFYTQALSIWEKTLGKSHPNYAYAVNNLANLYSAQGNYRQAVSLYQQALTLAEQTLGTQHPDFALALNNLAYVYKLLENYPKAEELYLQALAIREKSFGKQHPSYANSLNNLAALYYAQSNYTKAEELHSQALTIREKVFGKQHPEYALSLDHLAEIQKTKGNYKQAEELYLQALEIEKKVFGINHPDYASSLHNLAVLYAVQRKFTEAEKLFIDCNNILLSYYEKNAMVLSEKEKELFYNTIKNKMNVFMSLVTKAPSEKAIGESYNLQLSTKAILLQATKKIKQNIASSGDSILLTKLEQWQTQKENLSRYYKLTKTELSNKSINLDSLEDKANKLEKELSARSAFFAQDAEKKQYTWQDVQKKLKPDEAVLEMIRFHKFNLDNTSVFTDSIYYAALVITPQSKQPQLILLENGKSMEGKLLKAYQYDMRYQKQQSDSYTHYFLPLKQALKGVKKLYFSADGVYNQINLNTLYNKKKKQYLIDELDIVLVTSTKDLLLPRLKQMPGKQTVVLFGYPNYTMSENRPQEQAKIYNIQQDSKPNSLAGLRTASVEDLPGTKEEVEAIAKILSEHKKQVKVYLADEALEENMKELNYPQVLHIATHGYFEEDIDWEITSQNPLLRSGILLAGAARSFNQTPSDSAALEHLEDGILTAYEAMNLNLDGTELVILSACETGLGEVKNGEGVYGLQRAFIIAGAQSLLMSLWKVSDNTTKELMVNFYQEWLGGKTKGEAFRKAQQKVKTKFDAPYFWGAFVMLGQ